MHVVDRPPISNSELGKANWSRRYKENLERLGSGNRGQINTVVRQLSERDRTLGISPGEKRMLARARQMLDDPGGGSAGVREPRRPFPPSDTEARSLPADHQG